MKLGSNGQKPMLYRPVHSNFKAPRSFGKEGPPFSEGTSSVYTEAVNARKDTAMLRYSYIQIFCNF